MAGTISSIAIDTTPLHDITDEQLQELQQKVLKAREVKRQEQERFRLCEEKAKQQRLEQQNKLLAEWAKLQSEVEQLQATTLETEKKTRDLQNQFISVPSPISSDSSCASSSATIIVPEVRESIFPSPSFSDSASSMSSSMSSVSSMSASSSSSSLSSAAVPTKKQQTVEKEEEKVKTKEQADKKRRQWTSLKGMSTEDKKKRKAQQKRKLRAQQKGKDDTKQQLSTLSLVQAEKIDDTSSANARGTLSPTPFNLSDSEDDETLQQFAVPSASENKVSLPSSSPRQYYIFPKNVLFPPLINHEQDFPGDRTVFGNIKDSLNEYHRIVQKRSDSCKLWNAAHPLPENLPIVEGPVVKLSTQHEEYKIRMAVFAPHFPILSIIKHLVKESIAGQPDFHGASEAMNAAQQKGVRGSSMTKEQVRKTMRDFIQLARQQFFPSLVSPTSLSSPPASVSSPFPFTASSLSPTPISASSLISSPSKGEDKKEEIIISPTAAQTTATSAIASPSSFLTNTWSAYRRLRSGSLQALYDIKDPFEVQKMIELFSGRDRVPKSDEISPQVMQAILELYLKTLFHKEAAQQDDSNNTQDTVLQQNKFLVASLILSDKVATTMENKEKLWKQYCGFTLSTLASLLQKRIDLAKTPSQQRDWPRFVLVLSVIVLVDDDAKKYDDLPMLSTPFSSSSFSSSSSSSSTFSRATVRKQERHLASIQAVTKIWNTHWVNKNFIIEECAADPRLNGKYHFEDLATHVKEMPLQSIDIDDIWRNPEWEDYLLDPFHLKEYPLFQQETDECKGSIPVVWHDPDTKKKPHYQIVGDAALLYKDLLKAKKTKIEVLLLTNDILLSIMPALESPLPPAEPFSSISSSSFSSSSSSSSALPIVASSSSSSSSTLTIISPSPSSISATTDINRRKSLSSVSWNGFPAVPIKKSSSSSSSSCGLSFSFSSPQQQTEQKLTLPKTSPPTTTRIVSPRQGQQKHINKVFDKNKLCISKITIDGFNKHYQNQSKIPAAILQEHPQLKHDMQTLLSVPSSSSSSSSSSLESNNGTISILDYFPEQPGSLVVGSCLAKLTNKNRNHLYVYYGGHDALQAPILTSKSNDNGVQYDSHRLMMSLNEKLGLYISILSPNIRKAYIRFLPTEVASPKKRSREENQVDDMKDSVPSTTTSAPKRQKEDEVQPKKGKLRPMPKRALVMMDKDILPLPELKQKFLEEFEHGVLNCEEPFGDKRDHTINLLSKVSHLDNGSAQNCVNLASGTKQLTLNKAFLAMQHIVKYGLWTRLDLDTVDDEDEMTDEDE